MTGGAVTGGTVTTRVLLVEDNRADVELVREALLELGSTCELHDVENGVEALRFLRREGPFAGAPEVHLVLLDLNTPLLGGLALLSAVRAEPRWADVRLVVFSASHNPVDEHRALELGAEAYLLKPTGWDDFSRTVRDILGRWATPGAGWRAWERP